MNSSTELIEVCNKHFSDVFEKSSDSNKILMSFFGHFNQDKINRLFEQLEIQLNNLIQTKRVKKRIFSIVVEGLQNILLHGHNTKDHHLLGFFTLTQNSSGFNLYFGNLIGKVDYNKMLIEVDKINNMSDLELKEYHKKVLFEGAISMKGGAGLGLIITGMKSDSKLNCSFSQIGDEIYFYSLHSFVKNI